MTETGNPDRTGLRAALAALSTEAVNPAHAEMDTLSTTELVRAMNREDAVVPVAVAAATPSITAAVDAVAARMAAGGRLLYVGAGTAGRLGILDASECPPTFGTDPGTVVGIIAGGERAIQNAVENAEDDTDAARRDLVAAGVSPNDAVVGVSASGRTPYVVAAVAHAREVGAMTIGVACNERSPLAAASEIPIEILVGPEFLAGSSRLKAGTAQKLVLNMISTLSMVRLGKTYGNVMVDLQQSNEKLRARVASTVMRVAGVDAEHAADAIAAAGGSAKLAILTLKPACRRTLRPGCWRSTAATCAPPSPSSARPTHDRRHQHEREHHERGCRDDAQHGHACR